MHGRGGHNTKEDGGEAEREERGSVGLGENLETNGASAGSIGQCQGGPEKQWEQGVGSEGPKEREATPGGVVGRDQLGFRECGTPCGPKRRAVGGAGVTEEGTNEMQLWVQERGDKAVEGACGEGARDGRGSAKACQKGGGH